MKYIQHQNFQKLLFIMQKICFYYLYKDDESFKDAFFSFDNIKLYDTNVIKIFHKGKNEIEYISLLKRPSKDITGVNCNNITIYYKNKRNSKAFNSKKINPKFNTLYRNFIRYIFDNKKIINSDLQKIIDEGERCLESNPYIESVQECLNNIGKETLDNDKILDYPNHQKSYSLFEAQLQKLLSKYIFPKSLETTSIPLKDGKTLSFFWLLYHGLFIEKKQIKTIFNKCFKYYNFTAKNEIFASRINGDVYFSSPKKFNDPFDVNCFLNTKTRIIDNNSSLRNVFRIFCSTDNYNNLLMWAHYGHNHTGYCIEYDTNSIILNMESEMKRQGYNLIIVGKAIYSQSRKKLKPVKCSLPIGNLREWIEAAFCKDNIWQYENEFRFVIVDFNQCNEQCMTNQSKGIILNGNIKNIYLGVNVKSSDKSLLQQKLAQHYKNNKIYELKLSNDKYEVKLV